MRRILLAGDHEESWNFLFRRFGRQSSRSWSQQSGSRA